MPMKPFRITPPRVSSRFTQIPNEVILHESLTDRDKVIWMSLCSLCRNGESDRFASIAEVANLLGIPTRNLQRSIKALSESGFIAKIDNVFGQSQYQLKVDSSSPVKLTEEKERKLSGRQKLRKELVEVWNTKKPDNFPTMRGMLPEARLDVLMQHAEMLECKDLKEYLGKILLACKMNDWYKKFPQTFDNIFGVGTPSPKKFEKTQKMYQEAQGDKAEAAGFDRTNDNSWLEWFASKGHEFSKVERITMERFEAWKHETDAAAQDTLYVYSDEEGSVVHWTYKEHQAGVSYLPTAN